MKKATALTLLGGNTNRVGRRIGCTGAAIRKWPDDLPDRLVDRVVAAIVRDLVAANRNRLRLPNRITLPLELHRHLCRHFETPNDANARQEFTPTAPVDAGICTKKQQTSKRRAGNQVATEAFDRE
jgi:hypothetical protein